MHGDRPDVSARSTVRPDLPTGPCEPPRCQVASSQETNPCCQRPASTTDTPELGHAVHWRRRGHGGPRGSARWCGETEEG
ncbi:hypothetical protein EYF80_054212 [Liparis tanakae]|uniref:Uncharacterized protein n=1 Tax=Liparis tanakae TaxID=230148 RepID=A0A4Z2F390_9TELE|nr:hypothetical protein EYF80_054212 [Liparis tanakae]